LLDRYVDRRDEFAFTELVRRHGSMVLATSRRVLRHEHDSEDVFQAAFLVLAKRAATIRQGEALSGWLYQVAFRLAVRVRQKSGRRREQPLGPAAHLSAPTLHDRLALDDELATLPHDYRSVVILCCLEGRTQNEAARILATTADAVNSRLKRARELLRARFARNGIALAAASSGSVLARGVAANMARTAMDFAAGEKCAASATAIALANGAFPMIGTATKMFASAVFLIGLLFAGAIIAMPSNGDDRPSQGENRSSATFASAAEPIDKTKWKRGCIILWMSGGPSQQDTFDPKPGDVALFKAIDTNVKGLQFSETLPRLAKQANHLAVIRSMTHREGDHVRGMHLMQTAQAPGGGLEYPRLGSVLARELGDGLTTVPRFIAIDSPNAGAGFLGEACTPLRIGSKAMFQPPPADPNLGLPDEAAFDAFDKANGKTMRKNVTKAFALNDEKPATRDAYGRGRFGTSCLLARRLREAGVPIIEITLSGWDTHGNAIAPTQNVTGQLDAAFSTLLTDLNERKLLEQTLIVWMGEFGRTPRINANGGRDHYPIAFSAVLAGAGVKGGQTIGKTSNDGFNVDARPVSPAELHATIYQALGIDSAKKYRVPSVGDVHLLEKGTKAVKEALR
jgi:RNA polymerase sigma factor (sigma-70 family)